MRVPGRLSICNAKRRRLPSIRSPTSARGTAAGCSGGCWTRRWRWCGRDASHRWPSWRVAAKVSRATAYRYFPSRSKLVSAVIAEALAPVRRAVPQQGDAKQRLHELLNRTYSRFSEYEPHMRAALQLALEHQSLEAAGMLEEEPFRRGQRQQILKVTLAPLRAKLTPRAWNRLMKALAVVYGIEPMIVLKDICGANDRETEAVVRWMMDALVDAALREGTRK